MRSRSLRNWPLGSGLVKISANWSLVEMCSTLMIFLTMWDLKWWSLKDNYLVRGLVLWLLAIFTQLVLSSNVQQQMSGVRPWRGSAIYLRSPSRCITATTSRSTEDKAKYSDSVVLRAIKVWTLLFHKIGHPVKDVIKPVLELQESGSIDKLCVHKPAKSSSTWYYNPLVSSGLRTRPFVLVFNK